jgi:hypothetical protein
VMAARAGAAVRAPAMAAMTKRERNSFMYDLLALR